MNPHHVGLHGLQVVELCLAPSPLALEDLIFRGWPIINGHLNLDISLGWTGHLLLWGCHCSW